MKKNLLLLTGLLLAMVAHTQQPYEPLLSLSKYERTIRGEAEADVKIVAETGNITIHLKTPVYLNYNLNDIRMFSTAPLKYVELFKKSVPDLTMLLKGYYTDSKSNRVEAGLMYAEMHSVSYEEGNKAESEISGYCDNNLEMFFHIPNFEEQVRDGQKDLKYQLEITCKGTSNVQKDVKGKLQVVGMTITDGLILDVGIPKPTADLDDIPPDATIGSATWEKFMAEYFKNLPVIDADQLNHFLMEPAGQKTFPFQGMFAWKSHKYQVNYSGKITLDGTTVVDFNK